MPLDKLVLVCDNFCSSYICICVTEETYVWTNAYMSSSQNMCECLKSLIVRRVLWSWWFLRNQWYFVEQLIGSKSRVLWCSSCSMLINIIQSWALFFLCSHKAHTITCWQHCSLTIIFDSRFRTPYLHTFNSILTLYCLWQIKTNKNTPIPTIFLLKNKFC